MEPDGTVPVKGNYKDIVCPKCKQEGSVLDLADPRWEDVYGKGNVPEHFVCSNCRWISHFDELE